MGDGCISARKTSPLLDVPMTNEAFLDYLDSLFGKLSCGVSMYLTSEEHRQKAIESDYQTVTEESEFKPMYRLRTRSHPWFQNLADWYKSGEKRYPTDLTLNKRQAKMWYVCDGGLQVREDCADRAQITAANEYDRPELLVSLLDGCPVTPTFSTDRLVFSVEDTPVFLDWLGEPSPGFDYKW